MSDDFGNVIHTALWEEEAQSDNPYSAHVSRCRGYDVYGDLLGKASYIDYLHLLFKGERPDRQVSAALDMLAVALANPGPRDPSVHAAMAAGVGGSTAASALIAALAVGAGSYEGARDVFLAMESWQANGTDLGMWRGLLASTTPPTRAEVWPEAGHPAGFAPYGTDCAKPVLQTLDMLCNTLPPGRLAWLQQHRRALEDAAAHPLSMTGVAAAALADMGFSAREGEMLTLMLRLPGAAAHALEQGARGFRQFPFFELDLQNDPGAAPKAVA
jgi:citrate synthase